MNEISLHFIPDTQIHDRLLDALKYCRKSSQQVFAKLPLSDLSFNKNPFGIRSCIVCMMNNIFFTLCTKIKSPFNY